MSFVCWSREGERNGADVALTTDGREMKARDGRHSD
jgi:hypothetical protein